MEEDNKSLQIKEEIVQEKFRQFLVRNDAASMFVLAFPDDFVVGKDNHGICYTINVLKDDNNHWNVWEYIGNEVFMVFFKAEYHDVRCFERQEDAYINAAKRCGLDISIEDISYDENDITDILDTIKSAKEYYEKILRFFCRGNADKLTNKYHILCEYENEMLTDKPKTFLKEKGDQ